jgi:hypothetical protein
VHGADPLYLWNKVHQWTMDGRIHFGTKAESNARRERAFLALTPSERFEWFLRSFVQGASGPGTLPTKTANFIIRRPDHAVR